MRRKPTYQGAVSPSSSKPAGVSRLPPTGPITSGIPNPATGDGYRIATGTILMREIEPFAPGHGATYPLAGFQIEENVAGLQHAVQPLGPSFRIAGSVHSTTRTPGNCTDAGTFPRLW